MVAHRELTGSAAVNNPLRILQTLDHHLARRVEITLFGRAALALGYAASPAACTATHDVDVPNDMSRLSSDGAEAKRRLDCEERRTLERAGVTGRSGISRPNRLPLG
jgi:hypothetical protein